MSQSEGSGFCSIASGTGTNLRAGCCAWMPIAPVIVIVVSAASTRCIMSPHQTSFQDRRPGVDTRRYLRIRLGKMLHRGAHLVAGATSAHLVAGGLSN